MKQNFKYLLVIGIMFSFVLQTKAQNEKDKDLVQFSGLVLTSDSLIGISDVSIRVKDKPYGTFTTQAGLFSIATSIKDTLIISALGYKTEKYIVPSSFEGSRYSMIITLASDSIMLSGVTVKPFISKSLFDDYFVSMKIEDDELTQIAYQNLEMELMQEQASNMITSGKEAGKMVIQNQVQRYYYQGQLPPQNILSPLAWAQFIRSWKNGDLKNKNNKGY